MHIQLRIEQIQDSRFFFDREDGEALQWILRKGKMSPSFLHLEDIRKKTRMNKLWNGNTFAYASEEILPILHDFYSHHYDEGASCPLMEIDTFLQSLADLPHLDHADTLNGPITCREIETAIQKLNLGKSPSSDGLTTAFYKNFAELLSPILEEVFKGIFQNGHLSFTQRLAIIALIFKKGEPWLVPNYRPISLTNNDYKILAYILIIYLLSFILIRQHICLVDLLELMSVLFKIALII